MNKVFTISLLAVTAFFVSQQDVSARGIRFSTSFQMEFGCGNHGWGHAPYYPHYSPYPYYPAPIVIIQHAAPAQSGASQNQNWTPPRPERTPMDGTTWTQPYQQYGNYYYPAYWYGR